MPATVSHQLSATTPDWFGAASFSTNGGGTTNSIPISTCACIYSASTGRVRRFLVKPR